MIKTTKRFLASEAGAITVDWVVLTSFLVTLGAAMLFYVGNGTTTSADRIGNHLSAMDAPAIP